MQSVHRNSHIDGVLDEMTWKFQNNRYYFVMIKMYYAYLNYKFEKNYIYQYKFIIQQTILFMTFIQVEKNNLEKHEMF